MRGGYYANVSFMYPTLVIFSMFQGMLYNSIERVYRRVFEMYRFILCELEE